MATQEERPNDKTEIKPCLTTAQKRFLSQSTIPDRWVIPLHYEVSQGPFLQPSYLKEATKYTLIQHALFRSYFKYESGQWQTGIDGQPNTVPFYYEDLSRLSTSQQLDVLETNWHDFLCGFSHEKSPLLKVVLYELGGQQSLYVFMHHLVIDAYSAFIVVEDLQAAYDKIKAGDIPSDINHSISSNELRQYVLEYTAKKEHNGELEYWLSIPWHQIRNIPLDYPNGKNSYASTRLVTRKLDSRRTKFICSALPKELLGMSINDAMLFALSEVVTTWCTSTLMQVISVDGRGETLCCDKDTSRSVGWLGVWRTLVLRKTSATEQLDKLREFYRQYDQIPDRGLGYEFLLWNSDSAEVRRSLEGLASQNIMLNYLGNMDQFLSKPSSFGYFKGVDRPKSYELRDLPERDRWVYPESHNSIREIQILITAYIKNGELSVAWEYSRNLHAFETISSLADNFIYELEKISDHSYPIQENRDSTLELM